MILAVLNHSVMGQFVTQLQIMKAAYEITSGG